MTVRFGVGFLNAHLWGETARDGGRPTPLYWKDHERAHWIAQRVGRLAKTHHLDTFAFAEMFDGALARQIRQELKSTFPFEAHSPFAGGIPDVKAAAERHLPAWLVRRLGSASDQVAKYAGEHYGSGNASLHSRAVAWFGEERVFRFYHALLGRPLCWGAGLMLLSRHEIAWHNYTPHPVRVGQERFAHKGVLSAEIAVPGTRPVTVFTSHFQEGRTIVERNARLAQLASGAALMNGESARSVWLMDANVEEADPAEYAFMMRVFGLQDVYRAVHPDAADHGSTLVYDTVFQRRLNARETPRNSRIDYVQAGCAFRPETAQVISEDFTDPDGDPYSDHKPLVATMTIE